MEYQNKWHLIKNLFLFRHILICIFFKQQTESKSQHKCTMEIKGQKQKSEFNE
jgi:hypothetical protein